MTKDVRAEGPRGTAGGLEDELARLRVPAPEGFVARVLERVGLVDEYVAADTPIGRLFAAYNPRGVSCVRVTEDAAAFEEHFRSRFGRPLRPGARPPAGLVRALGTGRSSARLAVDLRGLTDFERAVLAKAAEIPHGELRSYAWVAAEIGRPKAVRAVGSALGRNPVPVVVPCHRVVRADGRIGEYVFGPGAKRDLLVAEGVDVAGVEALGSAGVAFVGSDTTGIFCVPACRDARRITSAHRVAFRSAADAARAGYRPCWHCRPARPA